MKEHNMGGPGSGRRKVGSKLSPKQKEKQRQKIKKIQAKDRARFLKNPFNTPGLPGYMK
jgi:hypothetical protein